jgi:competence protein ComEA
MKRHRIKSLAGIVLAGLMLMSHLAAATTAPININTASAAELATLSGIGPAKAQAIIDHREKEGQFKSIDDLKLVRGIGDKLLEQLRPHVTVEGTGDLPVPHPNAATAANASKH